MENMYLTETQDQVREMARAFADEVIRPMAEQLDREERFPPTSMMKWASSACSELAFPRRSAGRVSTP